MLRIGSGLSGVDLTVQRGLTQGIEELSLANVRLSTMQRINRGADDPAGLIAVGMLESELASLEAANSNTARAVGAIRTADAALGQTSGLLRDIKANLVAVAGGGLSDAEIDAKQIEIDAGIQAINRIGATTAYGGRKLLDGSTDPDVSGQAVIFAFSADPDDTVTLTLPTIHASALGGSSGTLATLSSGGAADSKSGNLEKAMNIVDHAEKQVLTARARAGAFEQYTVNASSRLLDTMEENLSQGISLLRDADAAREISGLVRAQILVEQTSQLLVLNGKRGE
jgi:flagellin-like hook-associated protein FlgL